MPQVPLGLAFLLAAASGLAQARPAELPPLAAQAAQDFVHAQALVDVGGGRKMNLYCRGEGRITVIFDAGLSDWSVIWALVQPAVATRTRACSYDRAGMGYSEAAVRPSTPPQIVADLHRLLQAAGVQPPYLLVGHSLGGFNMKLYAATYRSQVAGMVLVDPAEERAEARAGAALRARFGTIVAERYRDYERKDAIEGTRALADCARAAAAHDLAPDSDTYRNCTDPVRAPLGPDIAAERERLQVRSAYQSAQASEWANSVLNWPANARLDAAYARAFGAAEPFGAMPLVVLSHSIDSPAEPYRALKNFAWLRLHEQSAALSTHGVHRIVPETNHNIEVDQPQAIIDAIDDVLKAAQE